MENLGHFKDLFMLIQILVFLYGLILLRKLKHSYLIAFVLLNAVIIVLDIITIYFKFTYEIVNFILLLIQILQFTGVFFVFYLFDRSNRWITLIGAFVVTVSFYFEPLWVEKLREINFSSISNSIGCLFLLILLFTYFLKLSKSNRFLYFYNEPMFWISFGLLIYYLGSFPYWGMYSVLLNHYFDILIVYTWIITGLGIIANVFYFVAIYKALKISKYE